MKILNAYIVKRAENTSEKRAKFAVWGSIVFVLIGLMLSLDAESGKEMLTAAAVVGVFALNAWVSSKILAIKKQVS